MKPDWSKVLYVTGGLLAAAGLLLKLAKQPHWEIVLIFAAAALACNIVLDQFRQRQ